MCTEEAACGSFFVYSERGGKSNLLKNYQICEKKYQKHIDKELTNGYTKTIETNKNSQEDNQHGDKEKRKRSTRDY